MMPDLPVWPVPGQAEEDDGRALDVATVNARLAAADAATAAKRSGQVPAGPRGEAEPVDWLRSAMLRRL
jgi:hypothetical protein